MGNAKRSANEMIMPARAVPSTLVRHRPVTAISAVNASHCAIAFCPLAASKTNSVSFGAVASTLAMTLTIFCSCCIRSVLTCARPAESINNTFMPLAFADNIASCATAAASAPRVCATIGISNRLLQIPNCSIAAARNVSHAASMTVNSRR